ncbi:four-carbon acid sugar kinase family protein [Methylobacterium currus]|uniref:four-carbon acid sugar kinase family protein n=1 Tax=Methylobacterium currus TaxID=2051553 RepID=UPI001E582DCF|nr:four-carbon acid sugar kinase family protein [Methylobacterium currus]UHC17706.1 four-carbon acid sugar kinase family protein [Methylobacterium currus]
MQLGIIADDLTGAVMVAGTIEAAGIAAPVVLDGTTPETAGSGVVVYATRARLAPAAEAVAEVARLADRLDAAGCAQIAYKACATFDSTDDGNIGPVADLLAARYGQVPLLMSAGLPRFGTTVHQGYLFYRGRLVSESIKRFDPVTPMSDPDLVRSLGRQTRARVASLPHRWLAAGLDAARNELRDLAADGAAMVLMDCSDDADAATGAQLARDDRATIGSDPHIVALALLRGTRSVTARLRPVDGPGAVLVSSVGPVARSQVGAFAEIGAVLTLDIADDRPEAALVAEALDWATRRIGERPLAVATQGEAEAVARAHGRHGAMGAARRAERILGAVAAGLVARGVRRLVVSGGETSGAVAATLGITRLQALPEGPLGSGFCVAEAQVRGAPVCLSLFLKPGKLGADTIFEDALASMRDR